MQAQPIEQFGDGTTRRDYTYIDDVIQGTMAALQYEGPRFDIFNLGENDTIQLKDLIVAIENALGKKAKINQLPEQPGDMPLTCANISKARELLGYNPTIRLSEGLPKFIDWFLRWQKNVVGHKSLKRAQRRRRFGHLPAITISRLDVVTSGCDFDVTFRSTRLFYCRPGEIRHDALGGVAR